MTTGESLPRFHGERPIECSECKRPIAYRYTEVIGGECSHFVCCQECPILFHKLHGQKAAEQTAQGTATGICCGVCGTTYDAVRMGSELGCSECYLVFDLSISNALEEMGKIPPRKKNTKEPIHAGKRPGESKKLTPSAKLVALNEALGETLKREDYEQAALLRDQIKEITEIEEDG